MEAGMADPQRVGGVVRLQSMAMVATACTMQRKDKAVRARCG
jgi:hypothetical protein